ncbi:MAG: CinA family nicotinamide mononucleotide deamidase-related protein [Elusimicrobiota bacterium]
MRCAIINIGNELLEGELSNSSAIVSDLISTAGIKINRIITVGDNPEDIKDTLKESISRSKIIITIGGLGSTPDDITKNIVAEVIERKMKFSRKAMENVARYFACKGEDTPGECDSQGYIIEGAEVIENPKGSSPAEIIEIDKDKTIIMLPGPADEVEDIFKKKIMRLLKERYESGLKKSVIIHVLGLCSFDVSQKLKEILETESHLEEGEINFNFKETMQGCDVIVTCWGDNELLLDELLHKTKSEIYSKIVEHIYGENNQTLESVVGNMLMKKKKSLAVAESCTGGLLSSKITDTPGSSVCFKLGLVTYSSQAKIAQLKIEKEIISKYGAVSEQVAREMAEKVKEIAGAQYSISVTGYAGPTGGVEEEAGGGYIGMCAENDTKVEHLKFSGLRKKIKQKFASAALGMLWKELKEK